MLARFVAIPALALLGSLAAGPAVSADTKLDPSFRAYEEWNGFDEAQPAMPSHVTKTVPAGARGRSGRQVTPPDTPNDRSYRAYQRLNGFSG